MLVATGAYGTHHTQMRRLKMSRFETNQDPIIADSLEALHAVRAEVRGDVDASVVERLDEVIEELESVRRAEANRHRAQDILVIVAKAIELLPSVAKLLEQVRKWR
jgi:hypothetical protein